MDGQIAQDYKGHLKKYLPVKDELSVTSELMLRDNKLVILQSLWPDVLNKLHAGHQGISKCHQWALQSVWRPAISKDIEEAVNRCMIFCTTRLLHAEPLLSFEFPNYPWQWVASDLYIWMKEIKIPQLLLSLYWNYQIVHCYIQRCHHPHKKPICLSWIARVSNIR